MSDNSFGKEYKLCSKRIMDELFDNGHSIKSYPFVLKWISTELDSDTKIQIGFSVPKRNFKSAVKRNRIKRKCREAFRLNKAALESFCTDRNIQLALFLIYTAREDLEYSVVEKKIKKINDSLTKQIDETVQS